jgi:uncharacterized protein (DUF952 family)
MMPEPFPRIYHLALDDEWRAASESGDGYRRSTLGKSLDEVGFIHCSFAGQVQKIADAVYQGRRDVVLLVVDPSRLASEVRVESATGGDEEFPHIYGLLPIDAVTGVHLLEPGADGRLAAEAYLGDG